MRCFLSEWALKSIAPSNVLLYDSKDMPSVMVRIPKMTMDDLLGNGSTQVHPAFIVDGEEKDCIYISKYQNCIVNGLAYSLPGAVPAYGNSIDTDFDACEGKGLGWHMMTLAEYGLVGLLCKKLGTDPLGNISDGKDANETSVRGIPATLKNDGVTPKHLLTGSGPQTYSHNNAIDGIYDLKGNVDERVSGIRIRNGEIQILGDNDAANYENNPRPNVSAETDWKVIDSSTGSLVVYGSSSYDATKSVKIDNAGDGVRLAKTITNMADNFNTLYYLISATVDVSSAALQKLVALGLYPYEYGNTKYGQKHYYKTQNNSLYQMTAGGGYTANGAGIFRRSVYALDYISDALGFRSAYVEL